MARWIAFDEESTSAAAAATRQPVEFHSGDALDRALASGTRAVVVLPSDTPSTSLVVGVVPHAGIASADVPARYEAGGFLGLSDEPVYENERQEKKNWWRRFWS